MAYVVTVPPLQVPDEFTHLYRAYDVSEGRCIGPPSMVLPIDLLRLNAEYPGRVDTVRKLSPRKILQEIESAPLNESDQLPAGFTTANIYSCVPYVAPALIIGVARSAQAPPLLLLYLSRLANLLIYSLCVIAAFRILPDFKLLFAALALMPMTLQQAASVSADSLTFSAGFVATAYIIRLAYGSDVSAIDARHYALVALVLTVAMLCKSNFALAAMLFLIPAGRFGGTRSKIVACASLVLLCMLVVFAWQTANRANLQAVEVQRLERDVHVQGNIEAMRAHPFAFAGAVWHTVAIAAPEYLVQFVGKFGYLTAPLPIWSVIVYIGTLLWLAVTQTRIQLTLGDRVLLAAIFVASVGIMFPTFWALEATGSIRAALPLGTAWIPGIQGRYFIPLALPALLVVTRRTQRPASRYVVWGTLAVIVVSNVTALYTIVNEFYS